VERGQDGVRVGGQAEGGADAELENDVGPRPGEDEFGVEPVERGGQEATDRPDVAPEGKSTDARGDAGRAGN
jgi:hypothetical protein